MRVSSEIQQSCTHQWCAWWCGMALLGTRSSHSPGWPLDGFPVSPSPWSLDHLFPTNDGPE